MLKQQHEASSIHSHHFVIFPVYLRGTHRTRMKVSLCLMTNLLVSYFRR